MTERFAHNMASYPNGPCDYPSFAVACQKEVVPPNPSIAVRTGGPRFGLRKLV